MGGRRWVGPGPAQERAAEMLVQQTGRPPALAAILARLGVAPQDVEAFLNPKIRDLLPDPDQIKDMGKAAERVLQALEDRERIAIFADYDVDGGSSAALLIHWFRALGRSATLYVPDRIEEGYGPNPAAMKRLAADHSLIICVDCGTLGHKSFADVGADIIVLDHHLGGETLPPAYAVVNPNRPDESGALSHLAAAGVVFLLLVEMERRRRGQGAPVNLINFLDLVGLATVADVAPLIGVNRAFVRQGLAIMARRERPGLVALSDIARLDKPPTAYHLGYLLGPRINAGGRIGQADLGARLLSTSDHHEALALASRLDELNTERRETEAAVRAAALHQAQARADEDIAWAAGQGWHPGVVGIVASRLKDTTARPSIVIGIENGIGKGSGRSIPGIDLGSLVQKLVAEGLLEAGGGHKMAAGITVLEEKIEAAMQRLGELVHRLSPRADGPRDLRVDGLIFPGAVTPELIDTLDLAGPFGQSAGAPRFALPGMRVRYAKIVGSDHLKVTLRGEDGAVLEAISFGNAHTELGRLLLSGGGEVFHMTGRLEINDWGGRRRPQLMLEDAAIAK